MLSGASSSPVAAGAASGGLRGGLEFSRGTRCDLFHLRLSDDDRSPNSDGAIYIRANAQTPQSMAPAYADALSCIIQ